MAAILGTVRNPIWPLNQFSTGTPIDLRCFFTSVLVSRVTVYYCHGPGATPIRTVRAPLIRPYCRATQLLRLTPRANVT